MDKKGVTNFIFGLVGLFILILVLVTLTPVKYGTMDIDQAVEVLSKTQSNLTFTERIVVNPETDIELVTNIIYKFIDFIIYCSFEVAKLAILVADEHLGETGIKLLLILVMVSLVSALVPFVVGLIKLLLVVFVILAESLQRRKDRKRIKALRMKRLKENAE